MGRHGGKPPYPITLWLGSAEPEVFAFSALGRGRSRAMGRHGAKPHTPHYYYNGVVREGSSCGTHNLCEHLPSDKMVVGVVCRTGKLYRSINRVW